MFIFIVKTGKKIISLKVVKTLMYLANNIKNKKKKNIIYYNNNLNQCQIKIKHFDCI